MAGALKKGPRLIRSPFARQAFDRLSKAALVDLVSDMLRGDAGDEALDDEGLVRALCTRAAPVLVARGDRLLRLGQLIESWQALRDRNDRARRNTERGSTCRYCDAQRPVGYAITCGRSECQQRDHDEAVARLHRRRRERSELPPCMGCGAPDDHGGRCQI